MTGKVMMDSSKGRRREEEEEEEKEQEEEDPYPFLYSHCASQRHGPFQSPNLHSNDSNSGQISHYNNNNNNNNYYYYYYDLY